MAQNAQEANRMKAQDWISTRLLSALNEWIRSECKGKVTYIGSATIDAAHPFGMTLKMEHIWPRSVASVGMNGETPQRPPKKVSYIVRLEVSAQAVTGCIEFEVEGKHKSSSRAPDILEWDEDQIIEDLEHRMCGEV
jgi:hypothetical protein